jgi:hypothetical protein
MRLALLFVFAVMAAPAQTNVVAPARQLEAISNSSPETVQATAGQGLSSAQRYEKARLECIQSRRIICGKIVKVLPDGLVVDSGYTNLMRAPIDHSWLIPGTVTASRAVNLVEAGRPDAICVGLVFLTDLPKSPGAKPKLYDYVNLEGFPVGQYTYTSVGDIRRTVREFGAKLENATLRNLAQGESRNASLK